MMDYHSIHGSDIASFSISNTHRLPTVTASQALSSLHGADSSRISTGIEALDRLLMPAVPLASQIYGSGTPPTGGIPRGQVTEIWGPPGSGRTALGIQLTAKAMVNGEGAVWIDCFHDTPISRFSAVLEAMRLRTEQQVPKEAAVPVEETRSLDYQFTRYMCSTLPHLLALLLRPPRATIPAGTAVVVISGVSTLVNSALPRSQPRRQVGRQPQANPFAKRTQALQAMTSIFNKLAATCNCAVVVLSHCATKVTAGRRGATLIPAINVAVWEQSVATRLVLFRNWSRQQQGENGSGSSRGRGRGNRKKKPRGEFLAGVEKMDGRLMKNVFRKAVAFTVESTGVRGLEYRASQQRSATNAAAMAQQKRKIAQTELEVPDSEDDEYGWMDGDEAALPPLPPQWQGSEDILLGREVGRSESEGEGEDEDEDGDQGEGEGGCGYERGKEEYPPLWNEWKKRVRFSKES